MRVVVIAPPEPFVSLEEAKAHLRVDGEDDDALISVYVAAACSHVDGPGGWLGRAIGEQTLEARFDVFSIHHLQLPYGPINSIVSVIWSGRDGTPIVGDPADYELLDDTVVPTDAVPWEGLRVGREALRIQYRAGYAPVSTVPAAIKVAVLLMVGDLYRNRETSGLGHLMAVPMSTSVDALLGPFRVFR